MSLFENHNLLSVLNSFGDVVKTTHNIDIKTADKIVKKYESHYKRYNPRDQDNQRYGLSLTSLDGGFSGIPDLDSLSQYHKETGIDYLEKDFQEETPLLKDLKITTNIFDKYTLGRSHIIRLDKGGHFPPHRDLDDTFRLICWLDCNPPDDMVFLLENNVIQIKCGAFYFINTIKYHSLFSFNNNNRIIVINALLNENNVHQLLKNRCYR